MRKAFGTSAENPPANSNGIDADEPMEEEEALAGNLSNSDHQAEAGNYREFSLINVNTVEYSIPANMQFVDYLGGGNYGNVIKVRSPDGAELAVKKMYEPFSHEIKARRVYRELKLLQLINHENIIRFFDMYTPDSDFRSFKNVYIVSGYAGISLKQVLDRQKQTGTRLLNNDHIKYIVYQLLRALKYLHSANVIHRDLKPSNLAITEECDLTVLDFGLARTVSNTGDNLTAYVISRWYRSPEVIYWNNVSYNAKADMWSVGCILAELLTQKVLFPGSETMEQYKLIIRLCGRPDGELMNKIEQQNSPAMRMVIERMSGTGDRKNFFRVFAESPRDAVDLLDKLLVLDPDKRISVEEALRHVYMRDYHLPEDEPTAEKPFHIEENDTTKTLNDWREIVWNELHLHEQERHQSAGTASFPMNMNPSSNPSASLTDEANASANSAQSDLAISSSSSPKAASSLATSSSNISTMPSTQPISPLFSHHGSDADGILQSEILSPSATTAMMANSTPQTPTKMPSPSSNGTPLLATEADSIVVAADSTPKLSQQQSPQTPKSINPSVQAFDLVMKKAKNGM